MPDPDCGACSDNYLAHVLDISFELASAAELGVVATQTTCTSSSSGIPNHGSHEPGGGGAGRPATQ